MSKEVRIGNVSAIDYAAGTVTVTYPDMDDEVTRQLPLLSPMADEYFMPKVEDQVLVLHLSNGAAFGIIMGRPWDEDHKPAESGEGLFRKDFDRDIGKAFLRYDASSGELKIKAKKIVFEGDDSVTTTTKTLTATASASATTSSPSITEDGSVTVTKDATVSIDVVGGGISLKSHTHTGVHGVTTPPN